MGFRYGKVDKKIVMVDPSGATLPTTPFPPNPITYRRQKKEPEVPRHRQPQIVQVFSSSIPQELFPSSHEGQEGITFSIPEVGENQNTTQLQLLQGLSDQSSILLEADPSSFQEGEIVLQVEGQSYRFQLMPASNNEVEET
jgi:hypothetical protein